MPRFLFFVAALATVGLGVMVAARPAAGGDGSYRFGGSDSSGGPGYARLAEDYSELQSFEILDIPVASPPCDDSTFSIFIGGIPVTNYEFTISVAQGTIHGNVYTGSDGRLILLGTIDLLPPCEAHVSFHLETAPTLQGDTNCSLNGQAHPQSAGSVVPEGNQSGTREAITSEDILPIFNFLIFGPATVPSPTPTPNPTPKPGLPGGCTTVGSASKSGVIAGDYNCSHQVTADDILFLLRFVGAVALQDPVPAPDCVPVGHYYYADR